MKLKKPPFSEAKTKFRSSKKNNWRPKDKVGRPEKKVENIRPNGDLWLWGRHAVHSALTAQRRRFHQLLIAENKKTNLPKDLLLPVERVTDKEISAKLPPGAVHQGFALRASPLDPTPLDEMLAFCGPILVCDAIQDPQNLGSLFRSALAFGTAGMVIPKRSTPPLHGTLAKAAAGALDQMPFVFVTNISQAIEQIKLKNRLVIGLEGEADKDLHQALHVNDWPIALILGGEGAGLRPKTARHCDLLAKIPIDPKMESLNMAVAGAVALYAASQRDLSNK